MLQTSLGLSIVEKGPTYRPFQLNSLEWKRQPTASFYRILLMLLLYLYMTIHPLLLSRQRFAVISVLSQLQIVPGFSRGLTEKFRVGFAPCLLKHNHIKPSTVADSTRAWERNRSYLKQDLPNTK